jgi:hypothetical protein
VIHIAPQNVARFAAWSDTPNTHPEATAFMIIRVPAEEATRRMRHHFSRLQTSPQLAAVIDCLFDLPRRTQPAYAELALLDDRLIFARAENEKTFRHFVGRRDQLTTNLLGFVTHLKLGTGEREYVLSRLESIPSRDAR